MRVARVFVTQMSVDPHKSYVTVGSALLIFGGGYFDHRTFDDQWRPIMYALIHESLVPQNG
jgi:hypothetical protein